MRFLGGFLKFLAILLLIAATLACTAVAVMAEQVEAYIVMGCVWVFALLVVLNIWGTGIALSNAAKNKKKIAQLEQKLVDMNYALSQAQARLQVYASQTVAAAPVQVPAAEGENTEAQPVSQTPVAPVAPVAEPVEMPSAPAAAPVQKSGKWIPAVVASVAVVAVAAVAIFSMGGFLPAAPNNNSGQNPGYQLNDPTDSPLEPTDSAVVEGIPVSVGGCIDNEFFTMTFESVEIVDEFSFRTSEYSTHSLFVEDGYKLLIVRGMFINNSTETISSSDMVLTAVVNDSFKADNSDVRLSFMRSNSYEIDPYTDLEYVMYVNIPERLAGMFETADFNIYFNSDLSMPTTVWYADGTTAVEADTLYTLTSGLTQEPVAPGEEGEATAEAMEEQAIPISIGETINTGDYEFTLLDVELTYEVLPPNTSSVYTSYPAESGKVYVHVEADVKNTMQRDIRISELFKTSVIYDGKYPYTGFAIVNDGDNRFDWVSSYVAATPLETCRAHGLVECPVEVDLSDNSLVVYLEMGGKTYKYVIR